MNKHELQESLKGALRRNPTLNLSEAQMRQVVMTCEQWIKQHKEEMRVSKVEASLTEEQRHDLEIAQKLKELLWHTTQ